MEDTLRLSASQLAHRRGEYGFDAPYVPIILGLIGVVVLSIALVCVWVFHAFVLAVICLVYGLFMLLSTAGYLYATRRGKFQVWAEILAQLGLRGDEQVL